MELELILQMGTDGMTPICAYHSEWVTEQIPAGYQMGPGLVHIYGSNTDSGTDAELYRWQSIKGHSFSFGLHATVFQAEIYAIKACIMENVEKGYTFW